MQLSASSESYVVTANITREVELGCSIKGMENAIFQIQCVLWEMGGFVIIELARFILSIE